MTGKLVLTRIVNASPEKVFTAWTNPEQMKQWWGPKGFTMPFCENDFRVGGACHYCMRSPDGQEFWAKSTYLEIHSPERVVVKETFVDQEGNPVSPAKYGLNPNWPAETQIMATFEDQLGKTKLTLTHAGILESGPDREGCEMGWSQALDRLRDFVEK